MTNIVGIKCIAPVLDRSGYAEWSRNYILSLIQTGVPVTLAVPTFDKQLPAHTDDIQKILPYINKDIDYNVVISWLTPNVAAQIFKQEKTDVKKVIFTLWETSRLPDSWVTDINTSVDECWLPGKWNEEIFKNSGVTVPLHNFAYPLNFDNYNIDAKLINTPFDSKSYVFYFISQWTERKNFVDLLEAYWHAFSKDDNVALIIKTHIRSSSKEEECKLADLVTSIKQRGKYQSTAPIILLTDLLSTDQMLALHKTCDCYVSASRGEGLGLGMIEAGLFGNTVITNTFGEHSSYVTEETAYLYNHSLRPVTGMGGPFYTSDQLWAQPDVHGLATEMREAYEHQNKARQKGKKLKEFLFETCAYETVSRSILERLETLLEGVENVHSKNGEGIKSSN